MKQVFYTLFMLVIFVACNPQTSRQQTLQIEMDRALGELKFYPAYAEDKELIEWGGKVRKFKNSEHYGEAVTVLNDFEPKYNLLVSEMENAIIANAEKRLYSHKKPKEAIDILSESKDPSIIERLNKVKPRLLQLARENDEFAIGAERREIASGWMNTMQESLGHPDFGADTEGKHDTTLIVMDRIMTPNIAQSVFSSEAGYWRSKGFKKVLFKTYRGSLVASFSL